MKPRALVETAAAAAAATVVLAVPLVFWRWTAAHDWDYFDSLAWVVRSAVLHYGTLPLHDPWMCGGVDIGANPQSRLLSPLMLLDLAFVPHVANLATLWLCAAGGFAGMAALLRHLGHARRLAWLGGLLFVGSTWFSLHWSEGHLRFALIALLPVVALAALRLGERRMQLAMATLLSLFMLEGAIYAFVYALYLLAALTVAGIVPWRAVLQAMRRAPWVTACTATSAALLVASKVVPIATIHGSEARRIENVVLLAELPRILLWPVQTRRNIAGMEYGFHEYGMYVGVAAIALVTWSLLDRTLRRALRPWLVVAALFFWAATNWLAPLSPWTALQHVPVLRNTHVPSRMFVLFHIAWIVILVASLSRLRSRPKLVAAAAVFLSVETVAVATTSWIAAYRWGKPANPAAATSSLLTVSHWDHTIETAKKPEHYGRGLGSRYCYEPVQSQRATAFRGMTVYPGEIHVRRGRGTAVLESVVPGRVVFRYEGSVPAIVEINLNMLGGWEVESGNATVLAERARVTAMLRGAGTVTLAYRPGYWPVALWLWAGGAALLAGLWIVEMRRGRAARAVDASTAQADEWR